MPFLSTVRSSRKTCPTSAQSRARNSFNSVVASSVRFSRASMAFVAGAGCLPAAAIGLRIIQEQGQIFTQGGLIVLGNQQIVAPGTRHLPAPVHLAYAWHRHGRCVP